MDGVIVRVIVVARIGRPPETEQVADLFVKRGHERSTTANYHQGFFPPLTRVYHLLILETSGLS